jgi:hypothetical protein
MLAAVLEGIALPGTISETHIFRRADGAKSDLHRMRGDVLRVNASFKRVVSRNGNSKTPARSDAQDSTIG